MKTTSPLTAARNRLRAARRNRTLASHVEAGASGHGPERMAYAARLAAIAQDQLETAERDYALVLETESLARLSPDAQATALALSYAFAESSRGG